MEIYREKLKVMNKLNQRIGKENRVLEFCEDNEEILSDLNKYISDLINELIFKFLLIKLGLTFIK